MEGTQPIVSLGFSEAGRCLKKKKAHLTLELLTESLYEQSIPDS